AGGKLFRVFHHAAVIRLKQHPGAIFSQQPSRALYYICNTTNPHQHILAKDKIEGLVPERQSCCVSANAWAFARKDTQFAVECDHETVGASLQFRSNDSVATAEIQYSFTTPDFSFSQNA